jgi:hypothetical protein
MSKRMFECNVCGEPLAAATDDELLVQVSRHFEREHPDREFDEARERETIAHEAYTAGDS